MSRSASQRIGDSLTADRQSSGTGNAVDPSAISHTNNVTELVIRRFEQHYQNFRGFNNLESAYLYLAVFKKLYRFTPFSQDTQERIHYNSLLQLASYDISDLPMTAICPSLCVD